MQSVRFVGVAKSVGLGLASVGAPRSGADPKGVAKFGQWGLSPMAREWLPAPGVV